MPTRPETSITTEDALRETIRRLRLSVPLSYEGLAILMRGTGYPIHASAIQKMEKPPEGGLPRRITVNELVAYAKAFGVSAAYLLDATEPDDPAVAQTARDFAVDLSHEVTGQLSRRAEQLREKAAELNALADSMDSDTTVVVLRTQKLVNAKPKGKRRG